MAGYERTLLVKPEVFVYKIPPRTTARGYRASDWNLDKPDFVVRLRVISRDPKCAIRLEEKTSGDLFAECPVDQFPGPAVESVSDSSRYFVLRLQDASGRSAFLGIGFADRSDSFDLNVALQDYFKGIRTEETLVKEEAKESSKAPLDLAFKEGQTIKINIGKKSTSGSSTPRKPAEQSGGFAGLLPPPPGPSTGVRIQPPPISTASKPAAQASSPSTNKNAFDLSSLSHSIPQPQGQGDSKSIPKPNDSLWQDFQ